jgi:hypothetical protein
MIELMSTDWAELDRKCMEATGFDARTIAESLGCAARQDQRAPGETTVQRAVDIWWFTCLMIVKLEDGRSIGVPLWWFPKLNNATGDQRRRWQLLEDGLGITWPELEQEVSVSGLLRDKVLPAPR